MKKNKHLGSTLDSFLHEEGIYRQVTAAAVLEVFVEEARAEMHRQHRSQSWLAKKMGTSRSLLNRLFRPKPSSVNVSTLVKLADALNKDIRIDLVDRAYVTVCR
jgi:antitoxin HicB